MSKKLLFFIMGAAAGAAMGYLLSTEENREKLKSAARKLKDNFEDEIEKGKEFVNDLIKTAEETVGGKNQK